MTCATIVHIPVEDSQYFVDGWWIHVMTTPVNDCSKWKTNFLYIDATLLWTAQRLVQRSVLPVIFYVTGESLTFTMMSLLVKVLDRITFFLLYIGTKSRACHWRDQENVGQIQQQRSKTTGSGLTLVLCVQGNVAEKHKLTNWNAPNTSRAQKMSSVMLLYCNLSILW